ncbi:MAG: GH36-type glycosyl hydrolase domain-containing protein [Nitrospira sp.]
MMNHHPSSPVGPSHLESPSGLTVQVNANGSIRRMDHGDILLNLFLGNEVEGGPANIYLRRHGEKVEAVPLLGPRSPSAVRCDKRSMTLSGEWQGIRFAVLLRLAESAPAWFWHVEMENTGNGTETVDLIYAQDLALAHYGAVRLNEYYVSQYVDHTPLTHSERGFVLASRQNQSMGGRNPWCVIGSLGRGLSFATDALQVHGLATRAGRTPVGVAESLPGSRRQHEHSMAAIQDAPLCLEPGERAERGFFGWFEADHPAATSAADLVFVDQAQSLPEASPVRASNGNTGLSLFASAPLLGALDLTETEIAVLFGANLREVERGDHGVLSFFVSDRSHVALKAKELAVLRPHGHILRTGDGLTPDEAALTSTAWMAGVFHSMVTQGHVSINRFLSTSHSYLGLFRSHGQRLFVELEGGWQLFDVPSAFEMTPEACRWIYKHDGGLIRVESLAFTDRHELTISVKVLSGSPIRFLVSNHVSINGDDGVDSIPVCYTQDGPGVFVRPIPECDVGQRFPEGGFRIDPLPGTVIERLGGDELLFADGLSRSQPFVCLITAPALSIGFRITGCLVPATETAGKSADQYWNEMTAGLHVHPPLASAVAGNAAARLAEILPWFAHNALIHYLAPRGLEQYSGGGWGTRDITQGPVEMLLALGRFEPLRDLLVRVFKTQNPDGDWPQWFMFFERERDIRPSDSHGDIVFWPALALAQYLAASEDASILNEVVPFFHAELDDEQAEQGTILQHLERALAVIRNRLIPGTHLAAYGHGDWNDSLHPVDPAMRERLCSAWTVTLHYQTLISLAGAFHHLDLLGPAADFQEQAAEVRADFQRLLIVDGVLAGFLHFQDDGRIDYLLHPRDAATGLSYSLLAMVHAVSNGLFTPEQARDHFNLIERHLFGSDGARLFDWPMEYHGGPQKYFQRAESSTFFGREIGLMYTHAHLRYAEALWHYGDAENFFRGLCKANPIGISTLVPAATLRQANCYYSSSDAAFADRNQAYSEYDRAIRGEIPLDGGWRIYSSGAGIGMSLTLRCFIGLRQQQSMLVIDPVIPVSLNGMRAEIILAGHSFEVTYHIQGAGCGPTAIILNGADLPFSRGENPYRLGAAEIPMTLFHGRLTDGVNQLSVKLG